MSRIQGIDTIRVFAILAVIAIHTAPFGGSDYTGAYQYLHIAITQGARFAVPFFFVVSGYFFGIKVKKRDSVLPISLDIVKRLFLIWAFWSLIYILPYDLFSAFKQGLLGPLKVVYLNLIGIANNPIQFLFEGSKVHLWFVVSLALSVMITAVYLRFRQSRSIVPLVIFAILLYVFGLCAKAYSETPIGINIEFNTRKGPFFSTIFFVTGYALSQCKLESRHFSYGLVAMATGYVIHFSEIYYLNSVYHVWPALHDYVFGTYLEGLGAALMAFSNHSLLKLDHLSRIGKYTLGIYAIHFIFVDILKHFDKQISSPFWEIGYIFLVFILSVGSTLVLSKYKPLEKVFV